MNIIIILASQGSNHSITDKPSLIFTYYDGVKWARLYSDGWCEQGAIYTSLSNFSYTIESFILPYKDTNYQIIKTGEHAKPVSDEVSVWNYTIFIVDNGHYKYLNDLFNKIGVYAIGYVSDSILKAYK